MSRHCSSHYRISDPDPTDVRLCVWFCVRGAVCQTPGYNNESLTYCVVNHVCYMPSGVLTVEKSDS